jgi:UDP-N-acetylmuramate dehydrogenase
MRKNFDLTKRTSMRMEARSALFATVDDPDTLRQLMARVREVEVPAFLLGGGANTLFATSQFDGLVFALGRVFSRMTDLGGNFIRAGAGVKLPALMRFARDNNLMGLEFLTMIPGTVGGALAGNAGAGGWGLCDFAERVVVMTRTGFIHCVSRHEFRYAYRYSELRDLIILEADFRLEHFKRAEFDKRIKQFEGAKQNQPYNLPSAGCVFKNPKSERGESIPAGKIIDELQMKGYSVGSAEISHGHANFIVNHGKSTGEDFLALINLIRDLVAERRGIDLEVEVQIVGGPLNSVVLK